MIHPRIDILPFRDRYQPGIDALMAAIAREFPESIFSPQSKTIKDVSLLPGHHYWLAYQGDKVIGTIGLCALENKNSEVKRLFLCKEFRGQGLAKALLDVAVHSARRCQVRSLYLGTMLQFKAAQAFYEKQGFIQIPRSALPDDFVVNPVDAVFYKKELA